MIKRYLEHVSEARICPDAHYTQGRFTPQNLRDALGPSDVDELDRAPMTLEQKGKTAKALQTFRHKDKTIGLAASRSRPLQ